MCIPVGVAMIASTAMSAIGTGIAAMQANSAAQYRAKISERNAQIEREAGRQEQENTRQSALDHYRKIAQLKGNQIVGAAANGVVADYGTAGDNVADTTMLGNEDISKIYRQGDQAVRGHDISAWNGMAQANADKSAGKAALINGAFDMGSTVLSGVTQYKKLKAGMMN